VKIVLIDDHPVVRQGLEQSLSMEEDMEVVGMAASCPEGVELISAKKPDLAIVDMRMPGGGGLELIRQARKKVPGCRFVILTSFASQKEVSDAIAENVEGYILKDALPDEFISAIRLVARGRRYYDPEVIDSVMKGEDDSLKELTKRELEILESLAQGLTNKGIAKKFFISENTVKKHVCSILDKLEFKIAHRQPSMPSPGEWAGSGTRAFHLNKKDVEGRRCTRNSEIIYLSSS
jgi:two-component system nitrate/nitrite response regulator NarL